MPARRAVGMIQMSISTIANRCSARQSVFRCMWRQSMNATQIIAVIVGAVVAAVVTVLILNWFEVDNAAPIAGGVAGGLSGVIGASFAKRKK
jgi:hypothetical protein